MIVKAKHLLVGLYNILAFTCGFTRVKFGVKMDVIIHINLSLESLYLLKKIASKLVA